VHVKSSYLYRIVVRWPTRDAIYDPLIRTRTSTVRNAMVRKICPVFFAVCDWRCDLVTSRVTSSSAGAGTSLLVTSTSN